MVSSKKLRDMETDQLAEKLVEYRKEIFNLRFQHATAQLENTQRIPEVKRNIARILTEQRQRELGA